MARETYGHSETEWRIKLNRAVPQTVHVLPNPLILSSETQRLTCLSHIGDAVVLYKLRILSLEIRVEMCPYTLPPPVRIWRF